MNYNLTFRWICHYVTLFSYIFLIWVLLHFRLFIWIPIILHFKGVVQISHEDFFFKNQPLVVFVQTKCNYFTWKTEKKYHFHFDFDRTVWKLVVNMTIHKTKITIKKGLSRNVTIFDIRMVPNMICFQARILFKNSTLFNHVQLSHLLLCIFKK